MLRFIGVFMIFTAFSFGGMYMASGMKKKLDRLETLRRMTDETATVIRYRSLTVREIITQLKSNPAYSGFLFLSSEDYSDRSRPAVETLLEAVENDYTLSGEEKKLLSQLGSQLGATDTEGQLSAIAVFNSELEAAIKRQRSLYAVRGKLYRSMGILAGAMFGILII